MTDFEQQEQLRQSVEHIADRAAAKAVRDTLLLIGIDVANPIKAQEEMASIRRLALLMNSEETVGDLAFLARLHGAATTVSDTGWRTVIRVLVTAGLGLVALVTKDYWISHIGWK